MECGLIITDWDIWRYQKELEEILPRELNGISFEGGLIVRYKYVPYSVKLLHLLTCRDLDPLTPYWSSWCYTVTHSEIRGNMKQYAMEDVIEGIVFYTPCTVQGTVEIAIDPSGSLATTGVDFIGGLETAMEVVHGGER